MLMMLPPLPRHAIAAADVAVAIDIFSMILL